MQKKSFVTRMVELGQRKPYLRYPVLAVIAGTLACYHFGRFLYSLRKKAVLVAAACGVVLVCGHTHLLANAGNVPLVYSGENMETQTQEVPTVPMTELESVPEIQTSPWTEKEIVNVAGNIETEMMTESPANIVVPRESESTADEAESTMTADVEGVAAESESTADVTEQGAVEANMFGWNLILVNRDHALSKDYRPQTRPIGQFGIQVDVRIYEPLRAMLNAGNSQGCSLLVCSGYRPYERQVELYEEDVEKYMRRGYSYEKACELTEATLLPPGTSEHQAGLAVDIVATTRQVLDAGFENTREGKWLAAHAHEYGFILRYPKDKVELTQINYEPWHFRYVGVEAATEIYEMGYCLEEYIDILKERVAQGGEIPTAEGWVMPEQNTPIEAVQPETIVTEAAEPETVVSETTEPETVITEPAASETVQEAVTAETEITESVTSETTGTETVVPETETQITEESIQE